MIFVAAKQSAAHTDGLMKPSSCIWELLNY